MDLDVVSLVGCPYFHAGDTMPASIERIFIDTVTVCFTLFLRAASFNLQRYNNSVSLHSVYVCVPVGGGHCSVEHLFSNLINFVVIALQGVL